MRITIKLFAAFRETIGKQELILTVPDSSKVGDVYEYLVLQYPGLGGWRSRLRFAQNREFVDQDTPLIDGDEIAFIPPVSGG